MPFIARPPQPTSINGSKLFFWEMARTTMWEAFAGFAVAFVLAMIVATLMAHSRFIERAVLPLAVLVQVTPIIAYTPAIVVWQGFGFKSILVVTALVCFVPEFLIAWASSRIANRQWYCFIHSWRTSIP